MGDAGEGLVDAESRFAERVAEREDERRRRGAPPTVDPVRKREVEKLKLAKVELTRQATTTPSAIRREQIGQALADVDRRLAALQ